LVGDKKGGSFSGLMRSLRRCAFVLGLSAQFISVGVFACVLFRGLFCVCVLLFLLCALLPVCCCPGWGWCPGLPGWARGVIVLKENMLGFQPPPKAPSPQSSVVVVGMTLGIFRLGGFIQRAYLIKSYWGCTEFYLQVPT
jgi:hypothetical protein